MSHKQYFIENFSLEKKFQSLGEKLIKQLTSDDDRDHEEGLEYIVKNVVNKNLQTILLQLKPEIYSKFLESDESQFITNSLYIIFQLSQMEEFIHHFLKYDESMLEKVFSLLNKKLGENPTKRIITIITNFIPKIQDFERFNPFIKILMNFSQTERQISKLTLVLILHMLKSNTNIITFLNENGIDEIKLNLEQSTGNELIVSLKILSTIVNLYSKGQNILMENNTSKRNENN